MGMVNAQFINTCDHLASCLRIPNEHCERTTGCRLQSSLAANVMQKTTYNQELVSVREHQKFAPCYSNEVNRDRLKLAFSIIRCISLTNMYRFN